jgi:hypothetical protein
MPATPEDPFFPWDYEWRQDRIRTTSEEIEAMTKALETNKDLDDEQITIMKANLKASQNYLNALISSPFVWPEAQG